jgi:hypothetical protein
MRRPTESKNTGRKMEKGSKEEEEEKSTAQHGQQ